MLTDAQRRLYYESLGLRPAAAREVEEMRRGSPARKVDQQGLKNIIVNFHSLKNGGRRIVESYTVEFLFALFVENFNPCHEYVCQVPMRGIDRDRRITSMTADFMLFEPAGIRIVECKPAERLAALAVKQPDEWVCRDGVWTRPPVEAWARERGLTYSIWSPPQPAGIYQANLLVLYGLLCSAAQELADDARLSRVERALARDPLTIGELLGQHPSLSGRHVLAALLRRRAFGTLQSVMLTEEDHFLLFGSEEQARECDDKMLASLSTASTQPRVESPVLQASSVDYKKGKERLAKVRRMLAGELQITRRYRPLVRAVRQAAQAGENALDICLTHFANSGRRIGQLTADAEAALAWVLKRYQRDALVRTKRQAHDVLTGYCKARDIRTPSYATLTRRIQRANQLVRAYTEGGKRKYHAVEPAVDPSKRTLRHLIPGVAVHIDSSKFDNRCSPDVKDWMGFEPPTLYVAIDGAKPKPLGRALVFGPSCSNALALVFRDMFYRNKCLPRFIVADAGPEYESKLLEGLCDYMGAVLIRPPASAPRKNSFAENCIGRVNRELAHRLLGSTEPDQRGRSVSANKKSRATAAHNYRTVVELCDRFLFEDMPATPMGSEWATPAENAEQIRTLYGDAGVVQIKSVADFLIATSIPLRRPLQIDETRGIRHLQRTYSSSELLRLARTEKAREMRLDCANPRRMYVRFSSQWVLATTPDFQSTLPHGELSALFENMVGPTIRRENAASKDERRRQRNRAIQEANEVAKATAYLREQEQDAENEGVHAEPTAPCTDDRWSLDDDHASFPVEGDE